jgi:hypothetical protein
MKLGTGNLILLASLTLAGTTIAKTSMTKGPHASYLHVVLASVGVGFFLSLIAAGADNVAAALAWLVIVGALVTNGSVLFTYVGGLGKTSNKGK